MFTRQDVCQQSIAKMHLYKTKKNAFIVSTWNKFLKMYAKKCTLIKNTKMITVVDNRTLKRKCKVSTIQKLSDFGDVHSR